MGSILDAKRDPTQNIYCRIASMRYPTCVVGSLFGAYSHAGDALSLTASGMFIHPTVETQLDETVRIQGHEIRFVTVDLAKPTGNIVQRLRDIIPLAPRGG